MEGHVLEQCDQKVETSKSLLRATNVFGGSSQQGPHFDQYQHVSGHRTIIRGCTSCVIRAPCSGYLEHHNSIQLVPSGDYCEVEDPGDVKEVVHASLWRDVLELIAEIAPRDVGKIQTKSILDELTSKILGAPRGGNSSEKLRPVATHSNHPTMGEGHATKNATRQGQQVTWMFGSIVLFCCFLLSIDPNVICILCSGTLEGSINGIRLHHLVRRRRLPALDQMIACSTLSIGTQIPAAFHPHESNPSHGLKRHYCAVCICFKSS